ncbi:MAG: TetR/AcrR family transcriptional regulator [Chloroflexota bacterium]|nr:TetR/AcrR family transcriptional regulator [Chloroflexota bacterium]
MDALPPEKDGEPTTSRGRETKARIVTAAAELMYEHGVAATSVDDILAAAAVGKSQFYHYFSAKTELVAAVVRHQLARVLHDQNRFDVATWDGIHGWLSSLVVHHEERGFTGGCPLGSIVAEIADQDARLRTVSAEAFSRWEGELAAGLRSLQATGQLHADADPEVLAEEVLASIQGGYLLAMTKREARPMQNAITAAFARLRSYAT